MEKIDEGNGYLLSSNVEFWPAKLELYRRDTKKTFKIQYPASCCLLELIRKQPAIVTQSELMEIGWAERKEYVTANAYYQCILNLRKALEDAGLDSNFIRTVHRRGLRIAPSIKIDNIFQEELKTETQETEITPLIEAVPLTEATPSIKVAPSIEIIAQSELSIKHQKKHNYLTWISSTLIILFLAVFLILQVKKRLQDYNFDDYINITNVGECPVYVNPTLLDKTSFDRFIQRNNLSCKDKSWWYITRYPSSPRISLIRCLRPLTDEKKASCSTDYFYGLKNHD